LLFGFYPGLDLAVAGYFHGFEDNNHNMFALRLYAPVMRMRNAGLWIGTALVAPAVGALIIKLLLPRRKMLMSGRAVMFLIATMALAPGLLVNAVLKDHWGRPRPIDVTQFGGNQNFVAWWDPRGDCPSNCAFVSGDVAGAAWTIAPAALTPPQWRALAYTAALTLSAGMAAIRVMAGAHFPSDVIFAGVFTFLIIWITYAVVYRWRRTRFSDDDVEQTLERVAMPGYNLIAGLFGASRKPK
jgi:membrane-associated phospholipid phosphatase